MELEIETMSLNVKQLVRKSDLSYVLEPKATKKIRDFVNTYGVMSPIIVAPEKTRAMYGVIKGWETLEIAKKKGDKQISVVCVKNTDLGIQTEVALSFSVIEEKITAVSQSQMIKMLSEEENMTLVELSEITGKSPSWVSKKKSLVDKLCKDVLELVEKGTVAPRTAEEIAKLPLDKQSTFTTNAVIKSKMSKNKIAELVKVFKYSHTDELTKQKIIENPNDILIIEHEKNIMNDNFNEPRNVIQTAMNALSSAMSRIAMMSEGGKNDAKDILETFDKCLNDASRNLVNFMGNNRK
jgi:hypothetical protein